MKVSAQSVKTAETQDVRFKLILQHADRPDGYLEGIACQKTVTPSKLGFFYSSQRTITVP